MRAKRFWFDREEIIESVALSGRNCPVMISIAKVAKNGKKRVRTKNIQGRGRKRDTWVVAL